MRLAVILPAAGLGTRMARTATPAESSGTSRKQFMLLDGSPILAHTVRKFAASPLVTDIIVAVRQDDIPSTNELLQPEARGLRGNLKVVEGGNSRQESVEKAFASLDPAIDLVAVHDAVRPFIELETIRQVVDEANSLGAAIVGIVPVDTVKQVSNHAESVRVRATISRERLILAQTPQVFRRDILARAFAAAHADSFVGTDEASLVEHLGDVEISVVPGSDRNIKITRPGDMDLARFLYSQEKAKA